MTGTLGCLVTFSGHWGTIQSSEGIDLQYGAPINVSEQLFTRWENTTLFHHSFQLIFEFDSIHITDSKRQTQCYKYSNSLLYFVCFV